MSLISEFYKSRNGKRTASITKAGPKLYQVNYTEQRRFRSASREKTFTAKLVARDFAKKWVKA